MNNLTNILEDSNAEDQTTENLGIVSEVLQDVVGLFSQNFSVDEDVRYLLKENGGLLCISVCTQIY